MVTERRACIDVGSNSLLLLVEEQTSEGNWRMVVDRSLVTGLGESVKQTGLLSQESMARSLASLRDYFDEAKSLGCNNIKAAGTMAVRIAQNRAEFLQLAQDQGTPIEVLSGENEATLGFESVANDQLFCNQNQLAIIDPGGQSTELTIAHRVNGKFEPLFSKSFAVGTLGIRSLWLPDSMPTSSAMFQAMIAVDDILGNVTNLASGYDPQSCMAVVLGASATNLVTVKDEILVWDPAKVHGALLTFGEISLLMEKMVHLGDEGRAAMPGLEPGRERTIHIGALIIERFLHALGLNSCRVSTKGWRYAFLESDFKP